MTGFGGAASRFVAGATAATGFLGGALVIAVLAVGLRAGDLATLVLLAGAFAAGARFAAIVLAAAKKSDFFVVLFAGATFFVFFAFFAIIVFPIVAADFPNHTGQSTGCNGTVRLSTQLRPVSYRYPPRVAKEKAETILPYHLIAALLQKETGTQFAIPYRGGGPSA